MHGSRNLIFLAILFVGAGVMHFVIPRSYAAITPPWVPYPLEAVYLSGIAEIAGGIGLLIPRLRRLAGIALIALLIAVFPANIHMLSLAIADNAPDLYKTILFLRLPLQPLLIVLVHRSALLRGSTADSPPQPS